MIIYKIFDDNINIKNINDIFDKDINSKILMLVQRKYTNICSFDHYIVEVVRLVNRSLIEANQSNLDGSFDMCFQFEAKCIIYNINEIIFNMTIKDNINNIISCGGNNTSAIIKLNKLNFEFKKNDIIPIIVRRAKYVTGSNIIQVNAFPFIPIIDNKKIYYKIDNLSEDVILKLNEFINQYIDVEENIKKDILSKPNNKWNYFKDLMYPFKNKISEPKNNLIDLLEIKKLDNKIIYINNELDVADRKINIYSNNTEAPEYIEDSPFIILYDILKKYYLYLQKLNTLATMYNTDEKIKSNENIFNFYIKYKK